MGEPNILCCLRLLYIEYSQGAIIRVPTYRRYAKFMVWYFFVFRQVPRRYAEICYSRTYIFLLAITSKPGKVFKTVKNFSCTCKFHASDIFWDEKSQKVIFALDQKSSSIYRHRPTEILKSLSSNADNFIVFVLVWTPT